jgi:hypothetical protein
MQRRILIAYQLKKTVNLRCAQRFAAGKHLPQTLGLPPGWMLLKVS